MVVYYIVLIFYVTIKHTLINITLEFLFIFHLGRLIFTNLARIIEFQITVSLKFLILNNQCQLWQIIDFHISMRDLFIIYILNLVKIFKSIFENVDLLHLTVNVIVLIAIMRIAIDFDRFSVLRLKLFLFAEHDFEIHTIWWSERLVNILIKS